MPKTNVQNVFVDFAEYVTVIGNGQYLAPKPKKETEIPKDQVEMSIVGKVRTHPLSSLGDDDDRFM